MADTTIRRPVEWASYSDTNVGMVRAINEDSVLSKPEVGLWAVADGMGGHEAGDVASNMIVQTLGEIEGKKYLSEFVNEIEDNIIDINQRLLEYAEIMLDGRVIGSTLISLLIRGQAGVCMWVGDSRLYRYRNNELIQLSCDHSQVSELLKQGVITAEEAISHPEANVITRAVGTSDNIYVDIDVFSARLGDTFILCSDGLYNAVDSDDMLDALQEDKIEDSVSRLIGLALNNGAVDNISVILVKGVQGSPVNHV